MQECDRGIIDDIINNFEMKAFYSSEGQVKYIQVNLYLSKLSDDYVDAEKKYFSRDNNIIEEDADSVPVIAIWPSISMPEWKKYYIYCEGGKNGTIELNLDNALAGRNAYVNAVNNFPKSITLKRKKDGREYDIGMIFPEYDDKYDEEKSKELARIYAVVGIDFGASGTTVYIEDV